MSFSNFIYTQCTRRLSGLPQSLKPSTRFICPRAAPQLLLPKHKPLLLARRQYSTRRSGRTLTTRDSFAKVRFKREDIPSLQFWMKAKEIPGADLSANEIQRVARAYVGLALKNAPGWRERFITVDDDSPAEFVAGPDGGQRRTISAHTLHYVALMLVMTRNSFSSGSAGHLAMHILHTLSGLGYVPSTLTMVRMALVRDLLGEPQFEPAMEEFERILERIGDGSSDTTYNGSEDDYAADACTLCAIIYERENTREADVKALRWFRRAYELGHQATTSTTGQALSSSSSSSSEGKEVPASTGKKTESKNSTIPFDPRWQWKVSFALGVGRIRMRRGDLDKARDMFAMASSELDNADGYLAMADVLEKMGQADTDDYIEALEKAAISGKNEAARKLGIREWDRAAEEGLSKWEKRKRQVVAEEWMAVAGAL
ncbi:hypothetical protein NPX13_g6914 [Xylaria arbuscula]|uniref:Uncharacterized protein n=1 Tax=Xylaria arbuscula TaxID=114810 RepID=A0A9W8TLP4_9PEZI|nr:hypothetical protein NPX13_g6914 [Xylaria arbuscula]